MNIRQIIAEHEAAGFHFFEASSMHFFNSRISSYTRGRFFVTSERQDWEKPRLYTVRVLNERGGIDSIGNFQEYSTLSAAKKALDNAYIEHLEKSQEAQIASMWQAGGAE